jgi:hypothetical protein
MSKFVIKAIVILVPLQLVQVFGANKVRDSCLKSISDKLTITECKTLIHNLEKATGLNLLAESPEESLVCVLSLVKLNDDPKYSQNGTKGILLKGLEFIRKEEVKECLEKEYPDFLIEEDEGAEASEDLGWRLGDSSLTEGFTFAALLIIAILVIGFQTYTFARDFVRMSASDPSMPATCLFDQELGKISGSESESEEEDNIELETRTLISSTRINETSSQIKNVKFA